MLRALLIMLLVTCILGASTSYGVGAADSIMVKAVHVKKASEHETQVIFELGGYYPPQTFVLQGEKPRVVCDFLDARVDEEINAPIEIGDGVIERIRIGIHKAPKPKIRFVLDLVSGPYYLVDQFFFKENNRYVVSVKLQQ